MFTLSKLQIYFPFPLPSWNNNVPLIIQKKLQETENTLLDLEERHRQANATIREKEYLISNLLKSGSLTFCAYYPTT